MAYLPSGDWDVQAGAGYFANGIGKSGAGNLDVLDTLVFKSGKYIILYNPGDTEYATITKTDTSLDIVNGYDTISLDAETSLLLAINGTDEIEIDSGGMIVKGGNTIDFNNSANDENGDIHRDDTALVINSGTGGILDLHIAGASQLKLDDAKLWPTTTLTLSLGTGSYIFTDTYSEELYQYDTRWMNPPLDGAINTTNATPTIIATRTVSVNEAWKVTAHVIGFADAAGTSIVASFERVATFKRVGSGNIAQVGTTTSPITHEDNGATDCTLTPTTPAAATFDVTVTGAAANIRWCVNFDILRVPVYTA